MATLTPDRKRALDRANETKAGRRQLRADLLSRTVLLADVVASPPECVGGMWVFDLLQLAPLWGVSRARKALNRAQIGQSRPVRSLTPRERVVLSRVAGDVPRMPPRAARPPDPEPTPQAPDPLRCLVCDEHLREPSGDGRCGFCIEEGS